MLEETLRESNPQCFVALKKVIRNVGGVVDQIVERTTGKLRDSFCRLL